MVYSTQLTKQAVAHRLILNAVRMIDQRHDPLAVHCVAASASSLLRELVAGRSQSYGSRLFGVVLYENTLADLETREPVWRIPSDPILQNAVMVVRQGIESGTIVSAEDVQVDMPKGVERQAMEAVVAPFNFMKHGDRDASGLLDEAKVQPILSTVHAISAYAMLFPGAVLPEEVQSFIEAHISV